MHTHGTYRITVSVDRGQAEEVERVLDAVGASDPDGSPSFWDHKHLHHGIVAKQPEPAVPGSGAVPSETFDIGWRPLDAEREVTQTSTDPDVEKQKAYRSDRD